MHDLSKLSACLKDLASDAYYGRKSAVTVADELFGLIRLLDENLALVTEPIRIGTVELTEPMSDDSDDTEAYCRSTLRIGDLHMNYMVSKEQFLASGDNQSHLLQQATEYLIHEVMRKVKQSAST